MVSVVDKMKAYQSMYKIVYSKITDHLEYERQLKDLRYLLVEKMNNLVEGTISIEQKSIINSLIASEIKEDLILANEIYKQLAILND